MSDWDQLLIVAKEVPTADWLVLTLIVFTVSMVLAAISS